MIDDAIETVVCNIALCLLPLLAVCTMPQNIFCSQRIKKRRKNIRTTLNSRLTASKCIIKFFATFHYISAREKNWPQKCKKQKLCSI
jgi:hypothetical protein